MCDHLSYVGTLLGSSTYPESSTWMHSTRWRGFFSRCQHGSCNEIKSETPRSIQNIKSNRIKNTVYTYPGLEELVVDFQKTWQLHSDLLHGGGDEAHVPVQPTHFLLQELH